MPQGGLAGVGPSRPTHPESPATEHRPGRAVTPRPKCRVLAKHVENQEHRRAREGVELFRRDLEAEIGDVNWRQDRKRGHEANEKLAPGTGVLKRLVPDASVAPQVSPD